jgi:microcin C transport system substrate-binding protein
LDEEKKPKYNRGQVSLAHANPLAPKRGELRFPIQDPIVGLHPFPQEGEQLPSSVIEILTDSLMRSPKDDPLVQYGLVAKSITIPHDISWALFIIHPAASWHDGTSITASDVVFTFYKLKERSSLYGLKYRDYFIDVERAEVVQGDSVKFYFTKKNVRELPWIVGEMPIFSETFWKKQAQRPELLSPSEFGGVSGPYRMSNFDPAEPSSVTLERVQNYWAIDHVLNKGRNNFNRVVLRYYEKMEESLRQFLSRDHDFRNETIMNNWVTFKSLPQAKKGWISLEEFPSGKPEGMQGYAFNLRNPILHDKKLRKAINLAFDFEYFNRTLFSGKYIRSQSYFSNSEEFNTRSRPSGDEARLLRTLPVPVPRELLTFIYRAPRSDGSGDNTTNLGVAAKLLAKAGYSYDGSKGQLFTPKNEPVELEIIVRAGRGLDYISLIFAESLARLGIKTKVTTLPIEELKARKANHSFDLAAFVFGQSPSPGSEQRTQWGSAYVDDTESGNPIGIVDKNIDYLVDRIATSTSRKDLRTSVKVLDRLLLWGEYVVPHWHSGTERVVYWNKFSHIPMHCRCGNDVFSWWEDESKLEKLDH